MSTIDILWASMLVLMSGVCYFLNFEMVIL